LAVTVSDRAAAGRRQDTSGPALAAGLRAAGFDCPDPVVVTDEPDAIRAAVLDGIGAGAALIATTGGTGLGPRDVTPQAVASLFDVAVPGLGELLRRRAVSRHAALSRAVAGLVGRCLVIALPGAPAAVRDALAALSPLFPHLVEQLAGDDHGAPPGRAAHEGRAAVDAGEMAGEVRPSCPLTQGEVAGDTPAGRAVKGGVARGAGEAAAAALDLERLRAAAAAPEVAKEVFPGRSTPGEVEGRAPTDCAAPGGAAVVVGQVTAEALDLERLRAAAAAPEAGATAVFVGAVRDHDAGRAVTGLDYEAHPDAEAHLARLLDRLVQDHPDICGIAAAHRTGELAVGEVAFAAAVSAPHRAEAFAVCAELVNRVKAEVPIWTRQHFADGAADWVGAP
jgi:molybdenum cofactor synthesis domain-containing protein